MAIPEGGGGANGFLPDPTGAASANPFPMAPQPTTTSPRSYTGNQEMTQGNGTGATAAGAGTTPAVVAAPVGDTNTNVGGAALVRDTPGPPYINPPHHPLQEATFLLGRENARRNPHRGTMVRMSEKIGDSAWTIPAGQNYKFRFLYNPESITVNSNVYAGVAPPEFLNALDPTAGGAKFIGQESISFGLMLDRTQEVYEQGLNATRGTLVDLDALYKVVNGSIGMRAGFLYLSEVEVHFGPANALPVFRGYVTAINVTHTKFTPNMTPMRSIVDISMSRLSDQSVNDRTESMYGPGPTPATAPTGGLLASAGGATP